jgi:hypothetical protein
MEVFGFTKYNCFGTMALQKNRGIFTKFENRTGHFISSCGFIKNSIYIYEAFWLWGANTPFILNAIQTYFESLKKFEENVAST